MECSHNGIHLLAYSCLLGFHFRRTRLSRLSKGLGSKCESEYGNRHIDHRSTNTWIEAPDATFESAARPDDGFYYRRMVGLLLLLLELTSGLCFPSLSVYDGWYADCGKSSVCVVAMLRLAAALHATNELDGHWGGISLGQWANIETNVAIICCCLPTLRPLAKRLSPYVTLGKGRKWFTRSKSSGRAGGLVETISDGSSNEKVSQSLSKETGAVIVSELSSSSSGLKESNV